MVLLPQKLVVQPLHDAVWSEFPKLFWSENLFMLTLVIIQMRHHWNQCGFAVVLGSVQVLVPGLVQENGQVLDQKLEVAWVLESVLVRYLE